jgi:hypothetical protein
VPDLRNMFRRFTGTDADTANARALGSRQDDAFQAHRTGNIQISSGGTTPINKLASTIVNEGGPTLSNPYVGNYAQLLSDGTHGTLRMGFETRSINLAFAPRIHA